jgi:hypothetical protein
MAYSSFSAHPTRPLASENLLELFLDQLQWITQGAHEAKRVLTVWLLASPPPPSGPAAALSQARRLTARHLVQLEQLIDGMPLARELQNEVIGTLLQDGEACLRSGRPEAVRYSQLLTVLQRIASCFGTACASASESAIVLGRVDLAAVLTSWSAAWRELQRSLVTSEASKAPRVA